VSFTLPAPDATVSFTAVAVLRPFLEAVDRDVDLFEAELRAFVRLAELRALVRFRVLEPPEPERDPFERLWLPFFVVVFV